MKGPEARAFRRCQFFKVCKGPVRSFLVGPAKGAVDDVLIGETGTEDHCLVDIFCCRNPFPRTVNRLVDLLEDQAIDIEVCFAPRGAKTRYHPFKLIIDLSVHIDTFSGFQTKTVCIVEFLCQS